MTKFGLLYDRLIVDTRHSHSTYYHYVREVLDEMKAEFPHEDCYDWGSQRYEEWYEKWFGVGEEQ